MKPFNPIYSLPLAIFICLLFSCRKDVKYQCSGNCSNVVLAGQIWDESGKKGMKGVAVTARLYRNGSCWVCTPEIVGVATTDEDGRFLLNSSFDTSDLREKHIGISYKIPDGYLKYAMPVGPGIVTTSTQEYDGVDFYKMDNDGMQNIYFPIFKKTLITIALKRITPIVAGHKGVTLGLSISDFKSWWGAENDDTSLTWHTGENVYTKYSVINWVNDTAVHEQIDSIICQPGDNNKVSITY